MAEGLLSLNILAIMIILSIIIRPLLHKCFESVLNMFVEKEKF